MCTEQFFLYSLECCEPYRCVWYLLLLLLLLGDGCILDYTFYFLGGALPTLAEYYCCIFRTMIKFFFFLFQTNMILICIYTYGGSILEVKLFGGKCYSE